MPNPITQRAYSRIDLRANNAVDKDVLKEWLKSIGVGGLLGPKIRSEAADAFVKDLDKTGDRAVSYDEFEQGLPNIVAEVLGGKISPGQIDSTFDRYDHDRNDRLSLDELKAEVTELFRKRGMDHPDIRADVAAKSALDLLSLDRKTLSRDEFRQAVTEVFPELRSA